MKVLRIRTENGERFWAKSLADVNPEVLDSIVRVVRHDMLPMVFDAIHMKAKMIARKDKERTR